MLAGLFRLSFFLLRNFFACEFLLCAVVLNSCFLKRFIDQPPLSFVELIFFSLKIPPRKDGVLTLESEDTCLCKPIDWSMAAMLRDSVVVVVRTRPRAIPLAMIAIRKILHGFPFPSRDAYGAPLGGPSGRRSSAINNTSWHQIPVIRTKVLDFCGFENAFGSRFSSFWLLLKRPFKTAVLSSSFPYFFVFFFLLTA